MPNAGQCAGEEFAAFSGIIILTSYLFLFISFYAATYKKGTKSNTRKALRRMSQAPLPDPHDIIAHASSSGVSLGSANGSSNGAAKATGVKTNGHSTRSRKA
jgi:fatty acid elongase 3